VVFSHLFLIAELVIHRLEDGFFQNMLFQRSTVYFAISNKPTQLSVFQFAVLCEGGHTTIFKLQSVKRKSRPVSSLLTRTALNETKRYLPSQPHPFFSNHNKIKLTPFYTQP
jgi:hypothetical protein